ncbi:MAG: AAA family ATPase [Candidatus Cloacimonadaceae bacterium]|nr:AAA family ATPase [Bacteroidales bacterium]MDD3011917.1 AAA family ATPase [Bacteroidales bacterium]MDD3962806.1 AAA family ATPase [Bacteroidales bacterium]MDY0287095.1 AAA family ATPase [Bacteroidales bacterium]NCD40976.1 hypothetical protein [Bacteroidia bacterium]
MIKFKFPPTDQQRAVADKIVDFCTQDRSRVMILSGYAGTGKTTLIKAIIDHLKTRKIPCKLMAATGRAARVLQEKTALPTYTVHRYIYTFEIRKIHPQSKQVKHFFKLDKCSDPANTAYFVDEASMIGDKVTKSDIVDFGTGRLLTDLFTYVGPRKIIFIGDPAQLPPINYITSPALNPDYFQKNMRMDCGFAVLSKIFRYENESGIFVNTKYWRETMQLPVLPYFNVYASGYDDMKCLGSLENLAKEYAISIEKYGIGKSILVSFMNSTADYANSLVRKHLYPGKKLNTLNKGELLMVVQNNYKHDLSNGDHIVVTDIGKKYSHTGIDFIDIKGYAFDEFGQRTFVGPAIYDMLFTRGKTDFHELEIRLFQDFIIRMKKEHGITDKDDSFITMLSSDRYYNALRVKFGYAITCHKSQGGEWEEVYIAIDRALFRQPKEVQYRWFYTAVSRASKSVFFQENMAIK